MARTRELARTIAVRIVAIDERPSRFSSGHHPDCRVARERAPRRRSRVEPLNEFRGERSLAGEGAAAGLRIQKPLERLVGLELGIEPSHHAVESVPVIAADPLQLAL